MGYNVAVVGATGNVGRQMLDILAERSFPADEVIALASRRSQGTEVSFSDRTLKVIDVRIKRVDLSPDAVNIAQMRVLDEHGINDHRRLVGRVVRRRRADVRR